MSPLGRDTACVAMPGTSRARIAESLKAAFAEGLVSERTLTHRLQLVFGPRLVDPRAVVGDLSLRGRADASFERFRALFAAPVARFHRAHPAQCLLALDWSGEAEELVVGRASSCDVVLDDSTVSRTHARLTFRDGAWVIQDLASTNGTIVNGKYVGRCRLEPGDRLLLGVEELEVD